MDTPVLKNITRLVRIGELAWLAYLAVIAVMGYALARGPGFVPWFSLSQGALALLVLALTREQFAARSGRAFFPLVMLLMSALPIALNHFATRFGSPVPFFSAEGVVFRLLPLLVMAVVLLGWRYELRHVIWFCIGITLWELFCAWVNFIFPIPPDPFLPSLPQPPPVFGIPVMYAASAVAILVQLAVLLVVGIFVSLLMLRLRAQHTELERLARTDPLTGVYNRRYFWELGEREFERARRYDRALAIALFDLDHFKRINDTYGHTAGDAVIQAFAVQGKKNVRANDLFARYGGEEFVCLLVEATPEEALQKAEEIRAAIQAQPVTVAQQTIPLTVSVGVAGLTKVELSSFDELVNRADYALYEAKANGRNCAILFVA